MTTCTPTQASAIWLREAAILRYSAQEPHFSRATRPEHIRRARHAILRARYWREQLSTTA